MLPLKTKDGVPLRIRSEESNKFVSWETIRAFFNELAPSEKKFEVICLLLMVTGIRINEILNIQIQDFVPNTQFRWVEILVQKKRKENKILKRYIPECVACVLRDYIAKNWNAISMKENYLFPAITNNKHLHYTPQMFLNWFVHKRNHLKKKYPDLDFDKQMGCAIYRNKMNWSGNMGSIIEPRYSFSPHVFRRLFITRFSENTTPLTIKEIIGHDDLNTTLQYINGFELAKKQQKLAEEIFNNDFYDDYVKPRNPEAIAVWEEQELNIMNIKK